MKFSQEFIDRVVEANNIVDIISQHTELRPGGGGYMGRCPFPDHPEKTPSFSVSSSKQVYHCFGCKKSGGTIRFLQDYSGLTFPQAVEFLAERANIPMPQEESSKDPEEAARAARKRELLKIYTRARDLFMAQLLSAPSDSPVKKYILRRGISAETAETFQIGFATAEWDSLVQDLTRNHLSLPAAEDGKLIRARDGKTGYYDFFRDRLMFPVHNFKGEVIAFGGRIIVEGEPKYLNSPEHMLFSKRRTLYGLHQTARYIRADGFAVIVEGYMDLISLHQAGIKNVVASMGTALTQEHAYELKKLTSDVLVLFDGDSAGVLAGEKALPILLGAGLRARGITLPEKMDPDDFVRKNGAEALRELAKNAQDLFFLILQNWMIEFRGTPGEKLQLVDRLAPILSSVPDPRLKELYETELALRLGVDRPWLRKAFAAQKTHATVGGSVTAPVSPSLAQSAPVKNIPDDSEETKESTIQIRSAPPFLKQLVALSIENQKLFKQLLDAPWVSEITHPGIRQLIERGQRLYRQAPEKFDKLTGLLMSVVDQSEALISPSAIRKAKASFGLDDSRKSEVSQSFDDSDGPQLLELQQEDEKLWMDCVRKMRDEFLLTRAKDLQQQLRTNADPQLMVELQQVQLDRRRLLQDPLFLRTKPIEENL